MQVVDDFSKAAPLELVLPNPQRVPFVFSAPHSGAFYPRKFLRQSKLDRRTIRRSEDTFVDGLFTSAHGLGAPLLKANFPRVFVDVNRSSDELDPTMFDGPLPVPVATDSPRVSGGLGVIARIVGERQEIYERTLPAEEAAQRLASCYQPYHDTLAHLVDQTADIFGACALIDCHSMPSGAVRAAKDNTGIRPDVVVGDRFGTSCSPELTDAVTTALREVGFVVSRNRPYAGGFITASYGQPPRVHAIQLEINRALYMNETTYMRSRDFAEVQRCIHVACMRIVEAFSTIVEGSQWPLAAE